MTINTFTSGVNENFSTELNENFAYMGSYTYTGAKFAASSVSTTYTAGASITIPADTLELGNILVLAQANWNSSSSSLDDMKIVVESSDYGELDCDGAYESAHTAASVSGLTTSSSVTITVYLKSDSTPNTIYSFLQVMGV